MWGGESVQNHDIDLDAEDRLSRESALRQGYRGQAVLPVNRCARACTSESLAISLSFATRRPHPIELELHSLQIMNEAALLCHLRHLGLRLLALLLAHFLETLAFAGVLAFAGILGRLAVAAALQLFTPSQWTLPISSARKSLTLRPQRAGGSPLDNPQQCTCYERFGSGDFSHTLRYGRSPI